MKDEGTEKNAPRSTATPWWEKCSPSSRSVALRDHEREAERTQGAVISTWQVRPWRVSAAAMVKPTGPAPTIRTSTAELCIRDPW